MQWIRTRPVHAADFFHGTLELVEGCQRHHLQVRMPIVLDRACGASPISTRTRSFSTRLCAGSPTAPDLAVILAFSAALGPLRAAQSSADHTAVLQKVVLNPGPPIRMVMTMVSWPPR
jgi:hypothetical protein